MHPSIIERAKEILKKNPDLTKAQALGRAVAEARAEEYLSTDTEFGDKP